MLKFVVEQEDRHGITKLTYADYLALPGDERYELLDGELVLVASPNEPHQRTSLLGWPRQMMDVGGERLRAGSISRPSTWFFRIPRLFSQICCSSPRSVRISSLTPMSRARLIW